MGRYNTMATNEPICILEKQSLIRKDKIFYKIYKQPLYGKKELLWWHERLLHVDITHRTIRYYNFRKGSQVYD